MAAGLVAALILWRPDLGGAGLVAALILWSLDLDRRSLEQHASRPPDLKAGPKSLAIVVVGPTIL